MQMPKWLKMTMRNEEHRYKSIKGWSIFMTSHVIMETIQKEKKIVHTYLM